MGPWIEGSGVLTPILQELIRIIERRGTFNPQEAMYLATATGLSFKPIPMILDVEHPFQYDLKESSEPHLEPLSIDHRILLNKLCR